jgi:hypothetical protein
MLSMLDATHTTNTVQLPHIACLAGFIRGHHGAFLTQDSLLTTAAEEQCWCSQSYTGELMQERVTVMHF